MAEYENRERDYNDNLGQVIGRFCTAIVEADAEAKDAHVKRVLALLKLPNAHFIADTSVIGVKQPLQTRVSVPVLSIVKANPIEIDQANLSLDMNVSASTSDTLDVASKTSVEGSGRVGWGPFSIGIKIRADVSVAKESKRQSDYRSTTHADVTMKQGAPPEGLSLIIDSLNKTTTKALEINQTIIQAKFGDTASAAAATDDVPAIASGGGSPAESGKAQDESSEG